MDPGRDPQGRFATQALLCTDPTVGPDQILAWFVRRWQVEVTFEEARRHLGLETQRQWSGRAIARTKSGDFRLRRRVGPRAVFRGFLAAHPEVTTVAGARVAWRGSRIRSRVPQATVTGTLICPVKE